MKELIRTSIVLLEVGLHALLVSGVPFTSELYTGLYIPNPVNGVRGNGRKKKRFVSEKRKNGLQIARSASY